MTPDFMQLQRAQSAMALVERAAAEYRAATNAQRLAFAQMQLAHEELRAAYTALGPTPTPTIRLADEEMSHECEA